MIGFPLVPNLRMSDEFKVLTEVAKNENSYNFSEGEKANNLFKNRYSNVMPLDETRVMLNGPEDYINANYVSGEREKEYILTQAPKPETIPDFWRMVAQEKIPVVVMLTKLVENGKIKAHRYWPKINEPLFFEQFNISLIEKLKQESFTTRILELEHCQENVKRQVVQIHYKKWPDSGVPENTQGLHQIFALMEETSNRLKETSNGPITIHCSAGIGRAGTLVAAINAIKKQRHGEEIKIPDIVMKLRSERAGAVQTSDQYRLIYRLVEEDKIPKDENQMVTQQHSEGIEVTLVQENPIYDFESYGTRPFCALL